MLVSTLPSFHHWLLGRKATGGPTIVLFGFPELPAGMAHEVAGYLNEYHDEGAGRWTAFTPSLIKDVAMSPAERTLLGVPEPCPGCPPGSACCLRHVLAAIAGRGNVVLDGPLAVEGTADRPDVFRAALGTAPEDGPRFHLTLRPELFSDRALPSILGDTFLEWEATREFADTV